MKKIDFQKIALLVAVLLLLLKAAAWWITGSTAIFGDTLESVVNVIASAFGLYSLWLAAQPQDKNHPNGHGKIEFIAAGLEGGLILLAGLILMGKGVLGLFEPQPLLQLDTGIMLISLTGIANYILGFWLKQQGNTLHSVVLQSSGKHLIADAITTVGLVLGLILVLWTKINWLDNLIALLFSGFIIRTGWQTLQTSLSGIMDEADPELLFPLIAHIEQHRLAEWIDLHNLRVIRYGDALHLDCHVTLPWYYDQRESHAAVTRFEKLIDDFHYSSTEIFVHADPCEPKSCKLCLISDCNVRRQDFILRNAWTPDNVLNNEKHEVSPTL